MKIVHLSTMDISGGGGSRAAYRLNWALQKQGIDSRMLVKYKDSANPTVYGNSTKIKWLRKLYNLPAFIDDIPSRLTFQSIKPYYSTAWFPDLFYYRLKRVKPSIINLHWINGGFVRLESLAKWPWPLVWTLHDMWPFSGAEHYPQDERYVTGYTTTNRPLSDSGFDVNLWTWKRKQSAWAKINNLTIVSPSRWLADCARRSALFSKYPITVIPNGIDIDVYKPLDKIKNKRNLGFPLDKKIILLSAHNVSDQRKGADLLFKAINILAHQDKRSDYFLAVVGHVDQTILKHLPFDFKSIGYVADEQKQAEIYSASDLLVLPSRMDNLPNVVLEAMSCGTPCISFAIGGLSDIIVHEYTGYLARPFDVNDFSKGICWVLENHDRWTDMSKQSRLRIINHFSDTIQAQRYINVYQNLL